MQSNADSLSNFSQSPDGSAPTHNHVPAVDGIRTIAVLSVMAFHFGLPLYGGFTGVDVFFVISGFLITTLLLRDIQANQKISLTNFWVRRIRRLIPGMVFMVTLVALAAYFFSNLTVRFNLRGDITSTLAYVANWHFIASSNYFSNTDTVSPLLHMWSLAVEEQFYIIWPLILVLIVRFTKRSTVAVFWVSVFITIASALLMSVLWVANASERAYMGTDTRAFQLAIGTGLAAWIAMSPKSKGTMTSRSIAATLGLIGIAVLMVSVGNKSEPTWFYAKGGAVLIGLATALLLWATWTGSHLLTRWLSNSIMTYLGRLSYGMYLWHWPLFVFLGIQLPTEYQGSSIVNAIILTGLTILLAAMSYHLIEQPLRTKGLLVQAKPWKVLVATPLVLILIGLLSVQALGRVSGNKIIMLVGDSVPTRLADQLDGFASTKGWHVINAARGSCPALAFWPADPSGKSYGRGKICRDEIKQIQQDTLTKYHPAVVVWWSRYEITDRFNAKGIHLSPEQEEFWATGERDLNTQIKALTQDKTQLLFIPIEPTGTGIYSRCSATECPWFLRRLISKTGVEYQQRWNSILLGAAKKNQKLHYFDISSDVCHNKAVPCDDKVNGIEARPDGTHYQGDSVQTIVPVIVNKAISVASED
mgnify:CR=1 FL=1